MTKTISAFEKTSTTTIKRQQQKKVNSKGQIVIVANKNNNNSKINNNNNNGKNSNNNNNNKKTPKGKCQVCGDKARGYYYNALTCISCKIFFFRNATKEQIVICPKGEKCPITVSTRKNCTKCRLNKCIALGMRPFTGKIADEKLNHVVNNEERMSSLQALKLCHQPISPFQEVEDDDEEDQEEEDGNEENDANSENRTRLLPVQTLYQWYRRDPVELNRQEWALIQETQSALSVFEDENQLPVVGEVQSLIHAFNLTGLYIRRIIKFCKNIPEFKRLQQPDQMIILKQFYFEIILVRCAYQYDMQRDGYRVLENESGTYSLFHKVEILKIITNPDYLDGNVRTFARSFKQAMENDTIIRDLIIAQLLFNPHMRNNLESPELVRYQYYRYCHLLRRYLEHKFKSVTLANQRYAALVKEINFIAVIKDIKRAMFERQYEEFPCRNLSEILMEVFSE